ncbi:MAG TPA: carboxypeptidase-like regulatory domain-containing protein [Candidatus Thermoplasmatota archaeon]
MRFVAATLFLSIFLGAGCAEKPNPAEATREPSGIATLEFEGEGGTVSGIVTSLDLEPIQGATVALDKDAQVQTDEEGRFEFRNVAPGPHQIIVQSLGYASVGKAVEVEAGRPTELTFQLDPLAVKEAFHELIVKEGFVCFQVFVGGTTLTLGTFCPGQGSIFLPFDVRKDVETIIGEMVWTPSAGFTAKVFYLGVWQGGARTGVLVCDYCYGESTGASPVVTRYDGPFEGLTEDTNKVEDAIFTKGDPSAPGGVNLVYQQRTTVYNSLFYGAKGPAGFTAIPDA